MAINRKEALKGGIGKLLGQIAENAEYPSPEKVREITGTSLIPIAHIRPNPDQPRKDFNEKKLFELSESIRSKGILQPILVRKLAPDSYEIINGERRYRAAKMADLKTMPVYVRNEHNSGEITILALIENLHRDDLNPIETALSFQRLIDEFHFTHDSLAEQMNKDRSTVSNFIRLLKLPPDLQIALREGRLSMGHARALISLPAERQLSLFQQIVVQGLSVRATEQLAKQPDGVKNSLPKSAEADSAPVRDFSDIARKMTQQLSAKSQVVYNPKNASGKIQITFRSVEELGRLLKQLGIAGVN